MKRHSFIIHCKECGHMGDYEDFIEDYYFDEEYDDEIPLLQCPNCRRFEEKVGELFEDIDYES